MQPSSYTREFFRQCDADAVRRLFDDSLCAMNYGFTSSSAPWGISRFQGVELQGVGVFLDEGYGRRSVARTRRHILADNVSDFFVVVPLLSASSMAQSGAVRDCKPGHFRIISTAIPFAGYVAAAGVRDKYAELIAKIPGAMLRELLPRIDEMSNLPLPLCRGAGFLMKSFLDLALAEGSALSEVQAREFSTVLVRAVASPIAESAEYQRMCSTSPPPSRQLLREKAHDYIARHLADSALDCAMVARHCGVSVRYLRSVFAPATTIAAEIREARLRKCQSALRNVDLSHRTVADIAASWGFANPASFNRIYKARYGVSPGLNRTCR